MNTVLSTYPTTDSHWKKNSFAITLTVFGLVIVGTGGTLTSSTVEKWKPIVERNTNISFNFSGDENVLAKKGMSIEAQINMIREVLQISMSDLASLLDVTRQSIYKWISGASNPEPQNQSQITSLMNFATFIASSNVTRPAALIKMKFFDGESFSDLFKAKLATQEKLDQLVVSAITIERAYFNSAFSKSRTPKTSEWQVHTEIPGGFE